MAKKGLGRGLSALLTDVKPEINSAKEADANKIVGKIANIDLGSIQVNPFQPRTKFDEEALEELAHSIREIGIVQPITVRKTGHDSYQVISGERRLRASKKAGLKSIPAYIRLADDQQMLEMAIVENIQRIDLDPIEEALSYQRLMEECGLTQESVSERVGKKRSTVANYLRLLKLDPIIQTGMRDELLSMGHGRALINVENGDIQLWIYENILKNNLSVRQTEDLVKKYHAGELNTGDNTKVKATNAKVALPVEFTEAKKTLGKKLAARVDIRIDGNSGGGKIIINFDSEEDFSRIKNLF